MTLSPTRAYDLLEAHERHAVDDYLAQVLAEQHRKRERIINALARPIPSEKVRQSKGVLAKPLARAALAEKIKEAADEQDLSPSRVIQQHASIAFSNLADYLDDRNFGDFAIRPIENISREALSAVKKMSTIPGPYGIRTEIVLHDKHPSLKALGEMMGLVASDKAPALAEYVKPVQLEQEVNMQVPETAYAQLIEG